MNYTKLKRLFFIATAFLVILFTNEIAVNGEKLWYHFDSVSHSIYLDGKTVNQIEAGASYLNGCDNYEVIDASTWEHGVRIKERVQIKCKGHDIDSASYTTPSRNEFDPSLIPSNTIGLISGVTSGREKYEGIKEVVNKVANTLILILQVCTVAGIIFTGIRYMYAGIDAKSQIKKTLPYLITGIIIIFAGPTVIGFIVNVFKEWTN